jgi:hypothetical protein
MISYKPVNAADILPDAPRSLPQSLHANEQDINLKWT